MSLAGMLATGYAPTGLFPHAGMAFGMDRGLRREMAREEMGRRMTQVGRGGLHGVLHAATLGMSSYAMRRTGVEASWLTEMETERTLQNRLGTIRGGPNQAATGYGVSREFFRRGAGRGAVREIQERGGTLQAQFGYGTEQMNMLTRMATGSIDVTRIQEAAAGGRGGMRGLGREISDIRETAASMAREMQMSEQEIQEFFGRLKGVMKITGEGVREFQQENRRLSQQGPFSQRQVASMRVQFTQMGRQMYMGGADFGTEAMQQANRVAELRRSGVIAPETLLREGGGLDPQAMARMIAQRISHQAGLVQAGQFNQSLMLAGQNQGAYTAMMGGASYFQTQGAVGATAARNPFALLQAQLNPDAVRRVTMQAPAIAFQQAQQMGDLFVAQNNEQRRAQKIRKFGQKMGFDIRTTSGLAQSRVRYEELESEREILTTELGYMLVDMDGNPTRSNRDIREMSASLLGIQQESGESASKLAGVMSTITQDVDLQRRWSSAGAVGKSRLVKEVMAQEEAYELSAELSTGGGKVSRALGRGAKQGIKKAQGWARELEKKGVSNDLINQAVFGELGNFSLRSDDIYGDDGVQTGPRGVRVMGTAGDTREFERKRLVHVGAGKFNMVTQKMSMTVGDLNDLARDKGLKSEEELEKAIINLSGWHHKTTTDVDDLSDKIVENWREELGRNKGRFTPESLRSANMARQEWTRARRKGAGVLDIVKRAGIDIDDDARAGVEALLDMDEKKAEQFAKLQKDPRLAPIVKMAERFGGEGIQTKQDFTDMTKMVGMSSMRSFFKEYASSEEGAKRLGGKSFQEFLGESPVRRMNELFTGMSEGEKRAIMVRSLSGAIEKSQRLVNETKRGDPGMPMHVTLDAKQVKAISGSESFISIG
jgi:hypothetical protein